MVEQKTWVKLYSLGKGRGLAIPISKEILRDILEGSKLIEKDQEITDELIETIRKDCRAKRFVSWKKSGTLMVALKSLTEIDDNDLDEIELALKKKLLEEKKCLKKESLKK